MEVSRNALSVDSDGEVLSAWSSRFSVSTLLDTSRTVAMVLSTSMRVKGLRLISSENTEPSRRTPSSTRPLPSGHSL